MSGRARRSARRLVTLASAAFVAACAGAGAARSEGPTVDQNRITEEELRAEAGADVLTVIESLRPRWLRVRDRTFTGPTGVAVVVDGVRWNGGVGELARIRTTEVMELRYLSPADATTQFGPDMAGGAIVVVRKR